MLDRVSTALSALTHGASLVLTPKQEAPMRHIEFVSLAPDRALVVLVFADGHVENRVFHPAPRPYRQSPCARPANFLNAMAEGRTLAELRGASAATSAPRPSAGRCRRRPDRTGLCDVGKRGQ
jgi:heat-inducible transcriptional repressor